MITPGTDPGRSGTDQPHVDGQRVSAGQRPAPRPIGRSTLWDGGTEPGAAQHTGHPIGEQRSDTGSVRGAPRRSGSRSAGRDGRDAAAGERHTGTARRTRSTGASTSGSADPGGGTKPRRRPRPPRGRPLLGWRMMAIPALVLLTAIVIVQVAVPPDPGPPPAVSRYPRLAGAGDGRSPRFAPGHITPRASRAACSFPQSGHRGRVPSSVSLSRPDAAAAVRRAAARIFSSAARSCRVTRSVSVSIDTCP